MPTNASPIWNVVDKLIEQPSWGGRYIVDLKGLTDDPYWVGKRVGQSYEMARDSVLRNPVSGECLPLADIIARQGESFLGSAVAQKYGLDISLLIKLTQAKGNSFQVHLPDGKTLGNWLPKPEAWLFLAPGVFTFGIRKGTSFDKFSASLHAIDTEMHRLSAAVMAGNMALAVAQGQIKAMIADLDPYQYVNVVEAHTDAVVDLTSGGIHHSWEESELHHPLGNLVYEVQVDVSDDRCSMRGFDKGKILPSGEVRPTHVADYLATIERDDAHNDLSRHISKPAVVETLDGATIESIFRAPRFATDRWRIEPGGQMHPCASDAFQHIFVADGSAKIGDTDLRRGQSYVISAAAGDYVVSANADGATILATTLPTD